MEIYDAKNFIGCDVSKEKLDFAIHVPRALEREYPHIVVSNDNTGYKEFKKWLKANGVSIKDCVVALEHTGIYSESLCDWLYLQQITFVMLNPCVLKSTGRILRGKNDKQDSQRLAKYAYSNKEDLRPGKPLSEIIRKLRNLFIERDGIVQTRVALMNQRYALKHSPSSVKRASALIKILEDQEEQIESEMHTLIKSDSELKKNYDLVLSVKGIGPINAICFIITTCNFTRFDNARQFGAYASVVPYKDESGKSVKGADQVSALGNKKMKSLLTQAAQSAIQHDPEMKQYYNRKIGEGKQWQKVANAVKFKIILRVFAVVARQTPYVNTMKFASK